VTSNNRANTFLLGILTTILVGWVLHVGAAVLQPLVIALLLASMLQPVVSGLARWKIPPVLTVVLMVTLIFFGLARVGLLLQANINAFLARAPGSVPAEQLDPLSDKGASATAAAAGWRAITESARDRMMESSLPPPLATYLSEALDDIDLSGLATGLIGGGFDFTKGLLLVVIYMLFIFAEQTVFRRKILSVAGSRREDAARVLDTIGKGIQRYLGVKTLISFVTGSLCYAVLVALDIPFALLFGFLTFLLNYIPTFGSITAGILPVITALADGSSWNRLLIIFFTYLSVNVFLGSILEPRILGRELNLSPLVIIISVVVWAAIWGVIGTFLAVPLTAAAQIVLASQESTHPIAVLLSSGPPRERPPGEGALAKLSSRRAAGRKHRADTADPSATHDDA